jgi:hypothetical protein
MYVVTGYTYPISYSNNLQGGVVYVNLSAAYVPTIPTSCTNVQFDVEMHFPDSVQGPKGT